MKVHTWTALWVLGLVVAIGATQAMASPSLVAPGGLAAIEGNSSIQHMTSDGPRREQQIYGAADFGSEPIMILGYRLRPDGLRQAAATINYTGVEIVLSTASAAAPLSLTYAANAGSDATLVYSGDLALSTNPTNPGVGPNAFDMEVAFDTPFPYDPSQGDLLVDFTAIAIDGHMIFDSEWLFPSERRIIWSNPGLAVADNGNGNVFVRQFDVDPIPVPEPCTMLLVGSGLIGLAGFRRKLRK